VSASRTQSEPVLSITRTFDAPRALVFEMWTNPEHLRHWWGPKIFTAPVAEVDLRVGGKYLLCMQWPDGRLACNGGEFKEIVPPERLVLTQRFCDEHGNPQTPQDHELPDEFPSEMILTVTLTERDGKTTMTIVQGIPAGLAAEMGAVEGWNQSFDKMVAYLATL